MSRRTRRILSGLLLLVSLLSCQMETDEPGSSSLTGGTSLVQLSFGVGASSAVEIDTRSTLGIVPESRVQNIFLFIFDGSGKRVYGHYFDNRNLGLKEEVLAGEFDGWWRTNSLEDSDPLGDFGTPAKRTQGGIRLKAPNIENAELFAVANIDGDMVNISPEKLRLVRTKPELLSLTTHLNQETTSRNGYFTMTGRKDHITVRGGTLEILSSGSEDWILELERLDAKVTVKIRTETGLRPPKEAVPADADSLQKIKAFVPESWQVVNIPKACTLFDTGLPTDSAAVEEESYFSTSPTNFEDAIPEDGETSHTFSFYMMENREKVKDATPALSSPLDYHKRDLRLKKSDSGTYELTEGDMWKYAPQYGTYVVIKGELQMEVQVTSEAKKQFLNANVTYVFHLGDFAHNVNDFSVFRNTSYTYTLVVKGVDKIELEVVTSNKGNPGKLREDNSGAMGSVNIARESSYTFDAHFGQRVFCFDAASIDPSNTYWYVKTPFGKEGIPPRVAGKDIPSGYDYKWVYFKVNRFCDDSDVQMAPYKESWDRYYDGNPSMAGLYPYRHNNQPYPGDDKKALPVGTDEKLMNIVEFTEFIRTEREKLIADADGYLHNDPSNMSIFRDEYDEEWYEWTFREAKSDDDLWSGGGRTGRTAEDEVVALKNAHRLRIYVTCYVDEYYYQVNPITGKEETDYWKQFCNQPNRMMFILCDSHFSLDGDSNATGAVITIRQRAIQTPYNMSRESLHTAWGTESVDETEGVVWFYGQNETGNGGQKFSDFYIDLPVNTPDNGLYNTVSNWQLISGGSFVGGDRWDAHLDFEALNDANYVFLKDDPEDYTDATMRWSCLMRNRDLNGNGVIDAGEVRWYMATTEQIHDLFFGALGLSESSMAYSRSWTRLPSKKQPGWTADPYFGEADAWRRHFITSSISKSSTSAMNLPNMVRAEEGVTSGFANYREDLTMDVGGRKRARYTMRCVRNLGMPDATEADIAREDANIPTPIISAHATVPDSQIDGNSVYVFDCNNINEKSLRYYTTRELEPLDEFSESSRLYKAFETGPVVNIVDFGGSTDKGPNGRIMAGNFQLLSEMLLRGESPCPEGYRVPNVREAVAMYLFADNSKWWQGAGHTMTQTAYSCGPKFPDGTGIGNGKDYESTGAMDDNFKFSWIIINPFNPQGRVTISIGGGWGGAGYNLIRCVRDVDL